MKTSDKGNPNPRGPSVPATEHTVRPGQNRSCSFTWAAKQENSSRGGIFSLDFPFYRTLLLQELLVVSRDALEIFSGCYCGASRSCLWVGRSRGLDTKRFQASNLAL